MLLINILINFLFIYSDAFILMPNNNIKYNTNIKYNKNIKSSYYSDYSYKRENIKNKNIPIVIQGNSLRTWSYNSPNIDKVQITLSSNGRPLDSDIELWNGPDNAPFKMRVYNENGATSHFNAIIDTPRGPNTVAIKNIGQIEFPVLANVFTEKILTPSQEVFNEKYTIQGGALKTYSFHPHVDSVEIFLHTDGRPLNSRIELLQGPNNNKQVIELYTDNGDERSFFCILETPGSGNVVRIVNTAPLEFPLYTGVLPYSINYKLENNINFE